MESILIVDDDTYLAESVTGMLQPHYATHGCTQGAAALTLVAAPDNALRGIDTQAGLALFVGDIAPYRHWLTNFVDKAPVYLEQIRQALVSGQAEQTGLAAHTLKGRSGMLGMNELHALAAGAETAFDSGNPAEALLASLEQGVEQICNEINSVLQLEKNIAT